MAFSLIDQALIELQQHWIAFTISAIPCLINIALIYYVASRLPSRPLTNVFIAWIITLVCWQVLDSYWRISPGAEQASKFDTICSVGWILIAPLSFHFFALYTHTFRRHIRFLTFLNYFIAFIFLGIYPFLASTVDYRHDEFWGWYSNRSSSILVTVLTSWMGLLSLSGLLLLFIYFSKFKTRSARYYQCLAVMISYGFCVLVAIITEFVMPLIAGGRILPVTSTVLTVFSISTYIAIRQYGLLNGEDFIDKNLLLSSISDMVIAVNNKNRVIYINKAALKELGIEGEEVIGKLLAETISIQRLDGGLHDLNHAALITTPAGRQIRAFITENTLKEKNQRVGSILLIHNITDLINAYQEAEKQKEYLQQLFDASPLGIVVTDNLLRIKRANNAFLNLFGYSLSEIEDRNLDDLILPPSHSYHTEKSVSMALKHNCIQSFETIRKRKNGEKFDVLAVGYPITIDNKSVGLYGIYKDITANKEAQRKLIQKNADLQKANSELDLFVYHASHDIRSPLMSILGLVDMAKEEVRDLEALSYFRMIEKLILKLDEFTLNIIHFSRNTRTQINPGKVNINDLIHSTLDMLRHSEKARNIDFRINSSSDTGFVTDLARLQLVIANLLSNAIKYHKGILGESYINIEAGIENGQLVIKVEDNGIGIPAEKLDKIFEMFTRFSETSEGSGLGLYIVKEIVERLGGVIVVNSILGKGSVFSVTIPQLNEQSVHAA
jgi:PAS domain S-box-containing protein